jgi:hypothetical protein
VSQELIYTSAPKGLKPGSRGFSTVAMTSGLSSSWVDRLESLSGYQPIYPLGDANANHNPINFCHWRVTVAGKARSVLSRIAFAGADYSQRSNKFAHHIVLEAAEQTAAGPAWMMHQPGTMRSTWSSEPQLLPAGPKLPSGDRPAAVCSAWAAITGDAGWGGVLAESFINSPSKPAYVIFQPGTDVLALFEEALALLSPKQRWEISFNTYFTELPLNLTCAWRAVAAGTQAEKDAMKAAGRPLVIDLVRGAAAAPAASSLVTMARTGRMDMATAKLAPARQLLAETSRSTSQLTFEEPTAPGRVSIPGPVKRRRLASNDLVLEEPSDFDAALANLAPECFYDAIPPAHRRRSIIAPLAATAVVLLLCAGLIGLAIWRKDRASTYSLSPSGGPPTVDQRGRVASTDTSSPAVPSVSSPSSLAELPSKIASIAPTGQPPEGTVTKSTTSEPVANPAPAAVVAKPAGNPPAHATPSPIVSATTTPPAESIPRLDILVDVPLQARKQAATQPAIAAQCDESSDIWTIRLPLGSDFKSARSIAIVWADGTTNEASLKDPARGPVRLSLKANTQPGAGVTLVASYQQPDPEEREIATILVQNQDSVVIQWADAKITKKVQAFAKGIAIIALDGEDSFIAKAGFSSTAKERLILDAPLTSFDDLGEIKADDICNFTRQLVGGWTISSASDTGHAPWKFMRNGDVPMFTIQAPPSDSSGPPKFICTDWDDDLAAAARRVKSLDIIIGNLGSNNHQDCGEPVAREAEDSLASYLTAQKEAASAHQKEKQDKNNQSVDVRKTKADDSDKEAVIAADKREADAKAKFDDALNSLKGWRDELKQFTDARTANLEFHLCRANGTDLCTVTIASANLNSAKER